MAPLFPPLTIAETADAVAGYAYVAERSFAALGSWVPSTPDPSAKVVVAAHARAHAWYAGLWAEQLPAGFPRATTDTAGRFAPVFETLVTLRPVDRLAAFYRAVLPRTITAISAHAARCSPVADDTIARVLRIVRSDLLEQWAEGEAIVQVLLAGPGSAAAAAPAVAAVEGLWPLS
ncbi:MAG: hypothetical protein AB7L13_02535 [Acidimicrobiia bacterium]